MVTETREPSPIAVATVPVTTVNKPFIHGRAIMVYSVLSIVATVTEMLQRERRHLRRLLLRVHERRVGERARAALLHESDPLTPPAPNDNHRR